GDRHRLGEERPGGAERLRQEPATGGARGAGRAPGGRCRVRERHARRPGRLTLAQAPKAAFGRLFSTGSRARRMMRACGAPGRRRPDAARVSLTQASADNVGRTMTASLRKWVAASIAVAAAFVAGIACADPLLYSATVRLAPG